ncbi:alpha/beta-hydrolase, partial [Cadophora sp. DSE1049]
MSKPSILLIPGSFALPEFYDPVMDIVRAKGYSIRGLHLPTVGLSSGKPREGAPPTMYDDAAFIAKEVQVLVDEGKDVILICHSYGGTPTSQSTKGLSKAERQAEGKEGGIVRLAYMTAVVPALGVSAQGVLADLPPENQTSMKMDEHGWLYHDPVSASAALTFSDLPPAEGEAWIYKFPQHSAVSFSNELTHAGYKDISVSYLFCEGDLCVTPDLQTKGIRSMEEASGRKVDITSIKSDHVPPVSHPELVVEWILDVVGKAER